VGIYNEVRKQRVWKWRLNSVYLAQLFKEKGQRVVKLISNQKFMVLQGADES
jgi:hypothetical protein